MTGSFEAARNANGSVLRKKMPSTIADTGSDGRATASNAIAGSRAGNKRSCSFMIWGV